MGRVIIIIIGYGKVILPDIPNENVWMSEPELVELFGVTALTLRAVVEAVYKGGVLKECGVQKYVCLENSCCTDVFGSPMTAAFTLHIGSLGTEQVRKAISGRLYLREEKISIPFLLVSNSVDSFNYQA